METDSSTSLSSRGSEEDWLIRVCCPGARHRHCKNAQRKTVQKTGSLHSVDKEDDFSNYKAVTPFQIYPGLPRQESSDLQWLLRLRCPRAQMEQMLDGKQSLPAICTSLNKLPTKISRDNLSSEDWVTRKPITMAKVVIDESQDVVISSQTLLEKENYFVREVDRYLKHCDFLALRKREMLYKKWFESVSSQLLQKIQDKVDSQSSEEIEERKRKQLSLYLNYCNKKGNAFLESYSPSSYDPFFLKTCGDIWTASVPPLYDPLLKEIQGRYLEASIIEQCDTGKKFSSKEINELYKTELPPLPLSRQFMNPIEWLKIPAGYMESEVRQKSRRKMRTTRNLSSMDFKSWGDPFWLPMNKIGASARKSEFASMPNLLRSEVLTGSSGWKPAIKTAS